MVALPLRLDVGGIVTINILVQAPRCLIMTIYTANLRKPTIS